MKKRGKDKQKRKRSARKSRIRFLTTAGVLGGGVLIARKVYKNKKASSNKSEASTGNSTKTNLSNPPRETSPSQVKAQNAAKANYANKRDYLDDALDRIETKRRDNVKSSKSKKIKRETDYIRKKYIDENPYLEAAVTKRGGDVKSVRYKKNDTSLKNRSRQEKARIKEKIIKGYGGRKNSKVTPELYHQKYELPRTKTDKKYLTTTRKADVIVHGFPSSRGRALSDHEQRKLLKLGWNPLDQRIKPGTSKIKKREIKRILKQVGRFSMDNRNRSRANFVLGSQFVGEGLKMLDKDIGLTRKSRKKVKRRERMGRAMRKAGRSAALINTANSMKRRRYLSAINEGLSGFYM